MGSRVAIAALTSTSLSLAVPIAMTESMTQYSVVSIANDYIYLVLEDLLRSSSFLSVGWLSFALA